MDPLRTSKENRILTRRSVIQGTSYKGVRKLEKIKQEKVRQPGNCQPHGALLSKGGRVTEERCFHITGARVPSRSWNLKKALQLGFP